LKLVKVSAALPEKMLLQVHARSWRQKTPSAVKRDCMSTRLSWTTVSTGLMKSICRSQMPVLSSAAAYGSNGYCSARIVWLDSQTNIDVYQAAVRVCFPGVMELQVLCLANMCALFASFAAAAAAAV
jgi:hypothetical protein